MAKQGICDWGGCVSYDTPIIATVPDNDTTSRKRFCCLAHLACWSVKELVKKKGGNVGSSTQEQTIEQSVQAIVDSFVVS